MQHTQCELQYGVCTCKLKESPAKRHPPNGYAIIDCGHIPRLRLTVTRFTGSVFYILGHL